LFNTALLACPRKPKITQSVTVKAARSFIVSGLGE
jgi:hypothetical protein